MLRLSDFAHLPDVDRILTELRQHEGGLLLIAGPDAPVPPPGATAPHFLPSGRNTIFRILVSELLDAHPERPALVIAEERNALHPARRFKHRLEFVTIKPPLTYTQALTGGTLTNRRLVIVDRLSVGTAEAVLTLAAQGVPVITQLDTVYHGAGIVRQLRRLGLGDNLLEALRWIVTVQRLPALCPECRCAQVLSDSQRQQITDRDARYGVQDDPSAGSRSDNAAGCPACDHSGRHGDVAVFDLFQATAPMPALLTTASRLPLEGYVWRMARAGHLALSDGLEFEQEQMQRVYTLLASSEDRATQTERELERKTAELETANKVLAQRMRELISLEAISQALLSSLDLPKLGAQLIHSAMDLCKADRAVLYYVRSAKWAEVLAARGWPGANLGGGLARAAVYENASDREHCPYLGQPPGLNVPANLAPALCGLAIPLIADNIPAGLMIVQSTRRRRFEPGEVALLETLAGHAAVAMQRASLIEQLRAKIEALEAAQVELAQKERLERELELARELQFSMLPQSFPAIPSLAFAARYAPARQVGGDFYDVMTLPDGRVGLYMADVADKGMAAALYMTLVRTLMLATTAQSLSPTAVLRQVNSQLIQLSRQDMFVTLFYAVIDPISRRLDYVCAGHERPWLIRDGTLHPLDGHGTVLGLFEAAGDTLSEEHLTLLPSDRLVLYTDGLCDLVDSRGHMLGRERLAELVQHHAALPVGAFSDALWADLAHYQGGAEQFDDMALLTVALS